MKLLDAMRAGVTVYDLAQPLENGMPCSPNHPGFRMALIRRHGDMVRNDGGSGSNELIVTGGHVGTHIDALCHAAQDGRLFGGIDASKASKGGRFTSLGIDTVTPFFCRGVLFDIPKAHGVERLEPGYGVTAEDLQAAACDTSLGAGDVALVRTGWPQLYGNAEAYLGQKDGAPGVTESAAKWLSSSGISATGCDTVAYEQILPGLGHSAMPVHRHLLVEHGIHIIEVLNLEGLAASGATEFLFVLLPLKIVGGTGSPVRPVAVVEA